MCVFTLYVYNSEIKMAFLHKKKKYIFFLKKEMHIKVELRDFSSIKLAEIQIWIYAVLMGLWRSWRSQALLIETQNGVVPVEGNLGTWRKITYVFVYLLAQHLESY